MITSSPDDPGTVAEAAPIRETDRHRLLIAERRRVTLDLLEKRDAPVTLDDLAKGIAAREEGTASPERRFVARVALSLHHIHLPMMDAVGVIDYDAESHRIETIHVDCTG